MSTNGVVVGVDGGGTKTVGELADRNRTLIARQTIGPTNPNVVGIEESSQAICSLIGNLCSQASYSLSALNGIVVGLAGAGGEKIQAELRESIGRCLREKGMSNTPVQVVTDIRIALEGAFAGGPGIVVIAGTGSSIMFKTAKGTVEIVGGWGRVLGDEGSGYFIGLEALKTVAREYDGRGEAGLLRPLLAARFGLDSRYRIIEAVYRQQFQIPSIAPLVFEAAAEGDNASCAILDVAATLLADQVDGALARMGSDQVGLVLSGGLLEHETPYRDRVLKELTGRFPQVHIQPPLHSPVEGALFMALALPEEERA